MDGGQVALIGFLYQMIGTLALRVWANDYHPVESADLDILLGLIRDGAVYPEIKDIDALLVHRLGLNRPDAYVLMQFKYSHDPRKYQVKPSELVDICKSFLRNIQPWP